MDCSSQRSLQDASKRRKKTATERRAQKLRAETRSTLRLVRGLTDLDNHRGNQLTKIGKILRRELSSSWSPSSAPFRPPAESIAKSTDAPANGTDAPSTSPNTEKVDAFVTRLVSRSEETSGIVGLQSAAAAAPRSESPLLRMPDYISNSSDDDSYMGRDSDKGASSYEDLFFETGLGDLGNTGSSSSGAMPPVGAAMNADANADLGTHILQMLSELTADQMALGVHVESSRQRQVDSIEQAEEMICNLRKELAACRSQMAANEPVLQMLADQVQMLEKSMAEPND